MQNKGITDPILSVRIYNESDYEYHCVPGIPYPVRLNNKDNDKVDCPIDEKTNELVNKCNKSTLGCLGGNDVNYMTNKYKTFKCDDDKISSEKNEDNPKISACFYLKQKKPLVFSSYGKVKTIEKDLNQNKDEDTLNKKKQKYYGNNIEVLMDQTMCKKLSGEEGLSATIKSNYTKCKLNLSPIDESNGESFYLSGLNNENKPKCNNNNYVILKSNKQTCDNLGGMLLENKNGEKDISIYNQILIEISKKDTYFKNKLLYKDLSAMDKALFHSKYFPNFKTENQFADPSLKYCKVNICNDGNLQLRKKEDCLPNDKKGKAIIYAKRKQCDKLYGTIKDNLVQGSKVDSDHYYPCEFEVCNREFK